MKKTISVEVESSGYDLITAVSALIVAVKKSGGFTATAIPGDVAALVAELPSIIADASQIKGDLAEDKVEFVHGALEAALNLYTAVKS